MSKALIFAIILLAATPAEARLTTWALLILGSLWLGLFGWRKRGTHA